MVEAFFGLVEGEVSRRGGGQAELFILRERVRRYDARRGGIDSLSFSDTVSLGVRIFRDGRMGFSYGFRESEEEIARMVESALFCAGSSDPDDAHALPDAGGAFGDPPLYDPAWADVGEGDKAEFAVDLERRTLSLDPRMKRVRSASLVESIGEVSFRNSAGRSGVARESKYATWVESVAEENGEGQTGSGYGFSRRFDALRPRDVAGEAARKALRMLGARRLATGRYAAILENAASAELLEVIAPSFLASNVAKGRSILRGRLGKAVASPAVRISDDPLNACGSGAAAFDGEGTPCRENVLVEGGVLEGYLSDSFWGRKLGVGTSGNSARISPKIPPSVGISNLRIHPGRRTLEGMMRDMGSGILLTEFLGIHTADAVSGDFSVGAAGIRFEGGEEREAVRGFAVSGNILTLLSRVVEAGSDFLWLGNVGSPSLAVSELDVGGE